MVNYSKKELMPLVGVHNTEHKKFFLCSKKKVDQLIEEYYKETGIKLFEIKTKNKNNSKFHRK